MNPNQSEKKTNRPVVTAGFLCLTAAAFLDNTRGPILPILIRELSIPYQEAGFFLTVGNLAAIASVLALGYFLKRIRERRILIGVCMVSLLPGLIAPFVDSSTGLILLGIFIGASVALVGSLANFLTILGAAEHLRGRLLSAQQVTYGIGAFLAPMCFSLIIGWGLKWWYILVVSTAIFAILIVLFLMVIQPDRIGEKSPEKVDSTHEPIGISHFLAVLILGCYVGGEILGSMWMATLMIDQLKIAPENASAVVGYFFLGIAGFRFLSFLLVKPKWESLVICGSLVCGITGHLLGRSGLLWGFVMASMLGPFFPLFMADISRRFPKSWRDVAIWSFVSIQSSLAIVHLSTGKLSDMFGILDAYLLAPAILFLTLVLYIVYINLSRQNPEAPSQSH